MRLIHLLKEVLQEQDEEHQIETESDMEKILNKSSKITSVLCKLLSSQKTVNQQAKDELREVVSDIKCISYNPSIFRIVFKNGNFFQLKYSPSPLQLKYKDDFDLGDSFTVNVAGKHYDIGNKSEYQQALKYINKLQAEQPVNTNSNMGGGEDENDTTSPDTDTGDEQQQQQQQQDTGDEQQDV